LLIKEFEELWDKLDLIVDGGELSLSEKAKAGSTVIDFTEANTYRIIRDGRYHFSTKRFNFNFNMFLLILFLFLLSHYDEVIAILEEKCQNLKRIK
jgi:hypothetical protein